MDDHFIGVDDVERLVVLIVLPVALDDGHVRAVRGDPLVGGRLLE
jgi:hypothetical protein